MCVCVCVSVDKELMHVHNLVKVLLISLKYMAGSFLTLLLFVLLVKCI